MQSFYLWFSIKVFQNQDTAHRKCKRNWAVTGTASTMQTDASAIQVRRPIHSA